MGQVNCFILKGLALIILNILIQDIWIFIRKYFQE